MYKNSFNLQEKIDKKIKSCKMLEPPKKMDEMKPNLNKKQIIISIRLVAT
jgi:hypothetical protein